MCRPVSYRRKRTAALPSEEDAAGQEWNVGIALWEQIKEGRGRRLQSLFSSAGRTGGLSPCVIPPEDIRIFPTTARRKNVVKAAILPYAHRTHRP